MPKIISIRVAPKAKQNKVEKISEKSYKIFTTAAPDKGKANEAIVNMLAKDLGIAKSRIEIVSGFKNKDKKIQIN